MTLIESDQGLAAEVVRSGRAAAFGDVVINVTESEHDPVGAGLARYVGLDHLDSYSLRVKRWGDVGEGTSFTRRFRPGDVLFAKRRAYQRKAAVVDFGGVCSGDLLVFRPLDRVHPHLLPFIVQTDAFVRHAIATSAGSLSPRTKSKELARFRFVLPDRGVQTRVVAVLRKVEKALGAHEAALEKALAVQQALIDHLFERPAGDRPAEEATLGELCTAIVDGVHKRPRYTDDGVPFLTVENLTRTRGIDFTDTRFISEGDHEEFTRRTRPQRGDVLVSKDGTLGVARLVEVDRPFSVFVSVAVLKPDPSELAGRFLRAYFATSVFKRHLRRRVAGSALQHIHLVDFRAAPIPRRTLGDQKAVADEVETGETALNALEQQRERLLEVKRSLLATLLGQANT